MTAKKIPTKAATPLSWGGNGHDINTMDGAIAVLRETRKAVWDATMRFRDNHGSCSSGINGFLTECGLPGIHNDPDNEVPAPTDIPDAWLSDEGRTGLVARKQAEITAFQTAVKRAVLDQLRRGNVYAEELNNGILASLGLPDLVSENQYRAEVYLNSQSVSFNYSPTGGDVTTEGEVRDEIRAKIADVITAFTDQLAELFGESGSTSFNPEVYTSRMALYTFAGDSSETTTVVE